MAGIQQQVSCVLCVCVCGIGHQCLNALTGHVMCAALIAAAAAAAGAMHV